MPNSTSIPGKIGSYDIKRVLATGNMGDVYQATTMDPRTKTPVYHAVKVLNPEVAKKLPFVQRFRSEVKDDTLLEYKEIGYDPKYQDFFVSDYLEVRPISRAILRKERSPEILDLFVRVATALDMAHKKKYVHGNIKTSNLLIRRGKDEEGVESVTPILSDFGIAYIYNEEYFSGDRFPGIFPYMAPERIESLLAGDEEEDAFSAAADVYSLGVVLAETLSGTLPFLEADNLETLRTAKQERRFVLLHVNHPVKRVDIRRLNQVLTRCLAPDAGGRYAAAGEFAAALAACRLEAVPV